MSVGAIQRENNGRLSKRLKHFFMLVVWRVQQIAAIATLFITAMTLTLQLSGNLDIGIENPYIRTLATFAFLAVIILTLGYLWDKKAKMWVEQGEVVVERNPYMMYHMTAKEIVFNLTMWIPLWEKMNLDSRARVMEDWTKKAMEVDMKVKPRCDELIASFHQEQFIREKYPWYGGWEMCVIHDWQYAGNTEIVKKYSYGERRARKGVYKCLKCGKTKLGMYDNGRP